MHITFNILFSILWAVPVSIGFAILFNTPRRALWVVGLLAAVGFGVKTLIVTFLLPDQVIIAALAGASAVGLLGTYFAHRVHTPPIVFTIPAVINMIPGKYAYEFIIGLLKIQMSQKTALDFDYFMAVLSNGLNTGFILLVLSFGIILPILAFNRQSVKHRDLHRLIERKVIRRIKIIQLVTKQKDK